MTAEYFVLHRRDRKAESMKRAKGRMLYDGIKNCVTKEEAVAFGLSKLQDTPIVAKTVRDITDYNVGDCYVVAAYFTNKYHSSALSETFPAPTHEVVRCDRDDLDSVVKEMAGESPSRLYLGIEQTLMPSAVDIVRSVNQR